MCRRRLYNLRFVTKNLLYHLNLKIHFQPFLLSDLAGANINEKVLQGDMKCFNGYQLFTKA